MSAISQYTVVRGDTLFAISRKFNMTVSDLKALNALASDSLNIGQVLKVRVDSPFGSSTGTAPSTSNFSGGSSQSYVVVPGDTLFRIAGRFNMTVSELKALNSLVSDALSVGQVLKVRGSGSTTPVVNVPQQPVTTPVSTGNTGLYVVMPGDTLFALARRFGMTVSELKSINGLTSDALSVGQQLRIRGQGSGTVTPDPPFTPLPVQPPPVSTSGGDFLSARQQFRLDVRQESNARRYTLVVPLLNGGQVVASMRDNHTESRFMVFPNGILYHGQSNIELSVASIQAVGLTTMQARALQFVSTHEGNFDAINSYDSAIFSYGFIQFVGASDKGGSLNRLLASMKTNAGAAFQQVFGCVGIDVEGFGTGATVTVLDESRFKHRGDAAWRYIQSNIQLNGAFIKAGYEPTLIREQLRMANDLYVQPALNFKLDLDVGGIRIRTPRIGEMFTSEAALTIIISLAINQGTGGMGRIISPAVSRVAAQQRLQTEQSLMQIDERTVFQTIASETTDSRVFNRVNGVLRSGMNFA
ncbi:MAG: LysM peptidoglycan-binding domain-containing protein [Saprospiraceae bacterium]